MKVLETHEQAMSNQCIVCDQGIDRTSQHITVDTGFDFDLPGHPSDGRKYICQGCVYDIARACGFLTSTQLDEAQKYLRTYRGHSTRVLDTLRMFLKNAEIAVEEMPNAPNLDHLVAPRHVVEADARVAKDRKAKKDFVEVAPGASF